MVNRNTDAGSYHNSCESFSSDSKSILTIDILLENKRSTCSSDNEDDTPISSKFDSRSMVTISSWVSKNIKKTAEKNPIEDDKCACIIY